VPPRDAADAAQPDHRRPDEVRDQLRNLTPKRLLRTCAGWRSDRLLFRDPSTATKIACESMATRLLELDDEIAEHGEP
jgi:transposase